MMLSFLLAVVCLHGEWGRAPSGEFWNGHAQRFLYAPAFAFTNVAGAVRYGYEVIDDFHDVRRFAADGPTASLAGVWDALPVGYVTVICRGTDASGRPLGEAGRRTFWKKAPFRSGSYAPAKRTYALARNKVLDYFLGLPQTRYLAEHGRPDPSYPLNGYPTKMLASEIGAIVDYVKTCRSNSAGRREELLGLARKAADYLIAEAVPAGLPLAHFTRTYAKEGSEYGRFKGEQDTIMLVYPASAGQAFLRLHEAVRDGGYLAAAERIAATYLALQGADGTWYLKMNAVTGKPLAPNRLLPTGVIDFLEDLHRITGKDEYRAAADRAFASIEKGPMVDWNWEGQFEDGKPAACRWTNLTKHPPASVAMYLLKRFPGDAARLAQTKALVKFSEDQFVEWVPPYDGKRYDSSVCRRPDDGSWDYFCRPYAGWETPCALEQYDCYHPIDSSAAKMINAYLALWRATGEREYLDKARALGDSATRMQEDDGFICTWWVKGVSRTDDRYHTWINCLLATARALDNLARAESEADAK